MDSTPKTQNQAIFETTLLAGRLLGAMAASRGKRGWRSAMLGMCLGCLGLWLAGAGWFPLEIRARSLVSASGYLHQKQPQIFQDGLFMFVS